MTRRAGRSVARSRWRVRRSDRESHGGASAGRPCGTLPSEPGILGLGCPARCCPGRLFRPVRWDGAPSSGRGRRARRDLDAARGRGA